MVKVSAERTYRVVNRLLDTILEELRGEFGDNCKTILIQMIRQRNLSLPREGAYHCNKNGHEDEDTPTTKDYSDEFAKLRMYMNNAGLEIINYPTYSETNKKLDKPNSCPVCECIPKAKPKLLKGSIPQWGRFQWRGRDSRRMPVCDLHFRILSWAADNFPDDED